MKSPRGDYYQGDIADPHRTRHIAEQHIRDAIAEEREACAQFLIDEEFDNAEVIAAAIRARK